MARTNTGVGTQGPPGNMTIGDPVAGGTPTEILYTDNSGNLFSDARFTRDSSTNVTYLSMPQNAGVDEAGLAIDETLLGVPGTNGLLLRLADQAGTVGSAIMGVLNVSPLGAPSNYGVFAVVDDAVTLESSRLFMLPNTIGLSASDGVDAGLMQLTTGTADLGVDNVDGGGDDFAGIEARLNSGGGAQTLFGKYGTATVFYGWRVNSSGFTLDYDNFSGTPGTFYIFPTADGSNGEVLTTDGTGTLSFQPIPPATAALPNRFIGVGDPSGELNGYSEFTYDESSYLFNQQFPNNVNNGTALGSPLAFGAASFTGSGLDDITLNWSVSNYQSNKYGGNLTIQIATTGTPDTFNWFYTGGYSQTIGTATNVPITGAAQQLIDTDGNVIAEITFGATTGHTFGDSWNAGTSLSSYDWGAYISDSDGHIFSLTKPVYGVYELGDTNRGDTSLRGNQTRLQINDNIGEADIYASRYFRIEAPGGDTAVLADMQNLIWTNYGTFRVDDVATTSLWFEVDTLSKETSIGDIQSINNDTVLTVNDNTQIIELQARTTNISGGLAYTDQTTFNDGATPYTLTNNQLVANVLTDGAPVTIELPGSPVRGQLHIITDAYGNASGSNITIDGGGSPISGASTYVITNNYESVTVMWAQDLNTWLII